MPAGRPRKPNAIKQLQGNAGKRKLPKEPPYKAELPKPPSFVEKEGLREWKRLLAPMTKHGVLTEADYHAFALYCANVGKYYEIRKAMKEERVGSSEWHKLDRALDRCFAHIRAGISDLGLSPTTRSKVSTVSPKSDEGPTPFAVFPGGKK